ncbi:MAG: [FeFe] hydrogenase H-cluster radical SAM maturase HydG [Bacteroidetes bacterium GWE2_29_8]|nr:MAG: [FeFe] hydrogenase H-cluster radical SAM maturase HydG [Bacteroidetes bacterium GWE2_29_8]OFY25320.1 MAG: [FeFe] hydrogenase H-cluster radical SAM maturase HydG [Bacteroidetes bacterium GWF2_29_10]
MIYSPEKLKIEDQRMVPFIHDEEIWDLINNTKPDKDKVNAIIEKSLNKNRLTLEETATLINVTDPELIENIKQGARTLKERVYGERIVLFAPLYVGNKCINNCMYCGYRAQNKDTLRVTLDKDQLISETKALEDDGHKRLILVYGEHPSYSADFIAETVKIVYDVKSKNGEIRRVNINAAPFDIDGFRTIRDAKIGTYQIFQETYHRETYQKVHKGGVKRNYDWRLTALDRAQEAGIDDVGIGALFGLYDWRFEVLGLLRHVNHFEAVYNVGPHTISFPRLKNASNMDIDKNHLVSDEDFVKLVAILRLAVPYTGMILTAREPAHIRNQVLQFGVSQIDGGTNIQIGGYAKKSHNQQNINEEQFQINDTRTLKEIMEDLIENDYIPSFCTACYRVGRTGEHFMEFSVPGFIKRFCTPNALMTLAEYLEDYATEEVKIKGYNLINKKIAELEKENQNTETLKERIELIKQGKRDLYF